MSQMSLKSLTLLFILSQAMHYAMKYKMKAKMMDWRDGEESEEEYTNQGQGQGSMPQPQTNGQVGISFFLSFFEDI